MSDERVAAEVLVEGLVQGVGFRDFCVMCADRLGVSGYAMNLSDGRVRVVAEGPRDRIDALVRELERGPRLARVDRTIVSWQPASGAFTGFGVRYAGHGA